MEKIRGGNVHGEKKKHDHQLYHVLEGFIKNGFLERGETKKQLQDLYHESKGKRLDVFLEEYFGNEIFDKTMNLIDLFWSKKFFGGMKSQVVYKLSLEEQRLYWKIWRNYKRLTIEQALKNEETRELLKRI